VTAPAPAAVVDRELLAGELDRAHAEVREELGRANATALGVAWTVISFAGVALAVLLAGSWSPSVLPAVGQVAWWVGSAATLGALAVLGGVVAPRMAPQGAGQPPVHWGRDRRLRRRGRRPGRPAVAALVVDPAPRVAHLTVLARIAARKWARLRVGLLALAVATVLLASGGLSGLVGR